MPDAACIELKSLKFYMLEFRNRGIFYEAVTNQILDDLVAACRPRRMTVVGDFSARGGITTSVTATYEGNNGGARLRGALCLVCLVDQGARCLVPGCLECQGVEVPRAWVH